MGRGYCICRFSASASPAAAADSIVTCNDILIEILLLLPEKTLTKMKLVSKHWLSLISSDEFCRLRRCRRRLLRHYTLLLQPSPSKFFKTRPFDKTPIVSPYKLPFPDPKILSHCNGLILLKSCGWHYAYNPTTTQSRKILLKDYPFVKGFTLAFDPSKSTLYTIILIRDYKPKGCFKLFGCSSGYSRYFRIEVYDSVRRSWKIGSKPFQILPDPGMNCDLSGVHCNNVIYWNISGKIWFYDIGNRTFSALPTKPGSSDCEIKESNGNVFIIDRKWMPDLWQSVELWELQGNQDWLLKHKLRFHGMRCLIRFDVEMGWLVYQSSGKIMVYSFEDKSVEEVIHLSDLVDCFHRSYFLFDETLALV